MCTIGTTFGKTVVRSFKQCDLTEQTTFHPPQERIGQVGRYIAMTRVGRLGLWAGGNERGVTFTAADNYTLSLEIGDNKTIYTPRLTSSNIEPNNDVDSLFYAYEKAVADYDNAGDAAAFLSDFYLNGDIKYPGPFSSPDIALFSDLKQSIYIEYSPTGDFTFDKLGKIINQTGKPEVKTLSVDIGYFTSTNNCRLFNTAVTYPMNPSTYLRLTRAELLLQQDQSFAGIHQLLSDQYYGKTELSICREAAQSGQYYTQASVVFSASPDGLECDYVINGNPRNTNWQKMKLIRAIR